MTSFGKKLILTGMALAIATTGLAACGKKGKLTPPDGSTYPRQYPKPEPTKPEPAKPNNT